MVVKEVEFRATEFVQYFDRCRRAWYYRNVKGWEVESVGRNADLGTSFHKGLAAAYLGENPQEAIEQYVLATPSLVEDLDLAQDIFAYFWEQKGSKEKISKVVSVEEDVPLVFEVNGYRVTIHCHIDAAIESIPGTLIVRDHKTKDVIPNDYSWFDLDTQMMLYYVTAWKTWGSQYPFIVAEHNLVRRQVPPGFGHRELRLNKDGSVAKNNASTDPDDYLKTVTFVKSPEALASMFEEIKSMALELIYNGGMGEAGYFPRSVSSLCNTCPYLQPCVLQRNGDEPNFDLTRIMYQLND